MTQQLTMFGGPAQGPSAPSTPPASRPAPLTILAYHPSPPDIMEQNELWGANCGPCSLAAALSWLWPGRPQAMPVAAVRSAFPWFERQPPRRYTNLRDLVGAVRLMGYSPDQISTPDRPQTFDALPPVCVARIQFTGPWTQPGARQDWALLHTHMVAVARPDQLGSRVRTPGPVVYDVNAGRTGGWMSAEDWSRGIAPALASTYPRADGRWFVHGAVGITRR